MPLTRAKDINGMLKPATQFDKGDVGICEYCGAQVHRSTSVNGLAYMALQSGSKHTHPTCTYLVSHSVSHTLRDFDLGQFLRNLPDDPSDEEDDDPEVDPEDGLQGEPVDMTGPDDVGENNPGDWTGNVGINVDDQNPPQLEPEVNQEVDDGYERNCSSLRQMHEEDLLSALTPYSRIHGKQAKNVFVIPRFLVEALNTEEFRKGGERIIQCRAKKYSEEKLSIQFYVTTKEKGEWIDGKFTVYFPSQLRWRQFFEQLFEQKVAENGTINWVAKRDKRVLIAAEWKKGAVYYTKYRSRRQFYIYDK